MTLVIQKLAIASNNLHVKQEINEIWCKIKSEYEQKMPQSQIAHQPMTYSM